MNDITNLETYDYDLPEELIAQVPLENRSESRMLVYNKQNKTIEHKHFYDIVNYLKAGDVLVMNNTRVLPARIYGKKTDTGARIEILLLKRHSLNEWEALARPLKRLKVGTQIDFGHTLVGTILSKTENECTIKFDYEGVFEDVLNNIGQMPLPPYIHAKLNNQERYQTVYSKVEGSVAAPTAGLHFTKEILQKLTDMGVIICYVTLDIGLGTFKPCNEQDITKHQMHTEHCTMSAETAEIINKAKADGRRVVCVGTTSVRTVESCAGVNMPLKETTLDTNIFIYPGYKFKIVDALITNFHLPKSTLIMLVSAFTSIDETKRVYAEAVKEKYRFFSFGDCNFIY